MAACQRPLSSLLLITAVAVVALAPAHVRAAPPTPGAACGPNQGSIWLKVRAKDLAAAGGAAVDADGCIASDGEASSFVRGEFDRTLFISDVYFKATSTGRIRPRNAKASVIVGDVDLEQWIDDVRAGRHREKKVLERQYECTSFERSDTEQEILASCSVARGKDTVGFFVTVLAPNTRVCNLMVCGLIMLYSERGAPLTRDAPELYSEAVQSDLAAMGVARLPARAAGNGTVGPRALSESCAGYTEANWGRCPTGLVCARVYKVIGLLPCACLATRLASPFVFAFFENATPTHLPRFTPARSPATTHARASTAQH
jgi:hypothetical protein